MELTITNHKPKVVKVTIREMSIVKMLSDGLRTSKIAEVLDLSPRTIETLIQNLKLRTLSDTIPHLVAIFLRNKIID